MEHIGFAAIFPTERAAAGATMLDERVPGWHDKIDLTTIEIVSGTRCILGQLYGTYGIGLKELSLNESYRFGFTAGSDDLNQAWRDEVARRRFAKVPAVA